MTGADAKVYTVICAHVRAKNWQAELKEATIACLVGMTERAVRGAVRHLVELGLVDYTHGCGRGRSSVYRLRGNPERPFLFSTEETRDAGAQNPEISRTKPGTPAQAHKEEEQEKNNDNSKPSESSCPFGEIRDTWNRIAEPVGLAVIRGLSDSRQKHLRARWNEGDFRDNYPAIFRAVASSSFCCGKNSRNWKADFDWLIKNDGNYRKVLEGKYVDRKPATSQPAAPNPHVVNEMQDLLGSRA